MKHLTGIQKERILFVGRMSIFIMMILGIVIAMGMNKDKVARANIVEKHRREDIKTIFQAFAPKPEATITRNEFESGYGGQFLLLNELCRELPHVGEMFNALFTVTRWHINGLPIHWTKEIRISEEEAKRRYPRASPWHSLLYN